MAEQDIAGDLQAAIANARVAGDAPAVKRMTEALLEHANKGIGPGTTWEKFGGGAQRAVTGVKQLVGQATGAEARDEQRILDQADPSGIVSAIGSGAMLAPTALIGGPSVPGMALGGAIGAAAMPTEDDDVLLGKLKQGAAGAVLGPVAGKALPLAVQGTRAAGRGIANQIATRTPLMPGRRADIAAREFAETIPENVRGQAAADLVDPRRYTQLPTAAGGRATVPQTSAEVLHGTPAGAALGQQEAQARRLGGQMIEPLEDVSRGRTRAINEAIDTSFDPERQAAAREAMGDYGKTQSAQLSQLKPGFQYDPASMGRMVPAFQQAKSGVTGPVRDAVEKLEQDFYDALIETNKTGTVEALHNFRRTGINDRLSTMFGPNASQVSTIVRQRLANVRNALTSDIDEIIANNPTGRGFRDYMEGYSARAGRAGKMERGEQMGAALNRGTANAEGLPETNQLASALRRTFARGEEPIVRTGRDRGADMFTPGGRAVLSRTRDVLGATAGVANARPPGSATAANLLTSKAGPLGKARAAEEARQWTQGDIGAGLAGAAIGGGPAGLATAVAKQLLIDPARANALSDIARQVVGAMADPRQASAALANYAAQQGLRQNEAQFLQRLAQRMASLAQPAGIAAGAAMSGAQVNAQ